MAAITALAFVLGGIVGALHEATTKHVRCAEHGELVHAAGEVATHGIVPVAPQQRDERHASELPPAPKDQAGHEHCVIASALRASSLEARSFAAPTLVELVAEQRTAAPLVISAREHLYRTAPKTSPPA